MTAPSGFLNLHKPANCTSHDCVAQVRRLLRTKKVGHGGTLDPAATGVLPIAIGACTRLLPYLPPGKAYRAVVRLGMTTTTDDLAGEVLDRRGAGAVTLGQVAQLLPQFIGQIEQVPPNYSAIQVGGQRAYDRARSGEEFSLPARSVEVMEIAVRAWQAGEFPELTLEIDCGAGTYIRSIARDLGAALGCGGTLASLVRTRSGNLTIGESVPLAALTPEVGLAPPQVALQHLPQVVLSPEQLLDWHQGRGIPLAATDLWPGEQPIAVTAGPQFVGIGYRRSIPSGLGLLCPKVVIQV